MKARLGPKAVADLDKISSPLSRHMVKSLSHIYLKLPLSLCVHCIQYENNKMQAVSLSTNEYAYCVSLAKNLSQMY